MGAMQRQSLLLLLRGLGLGLLLALLLFHVATPRTHVTPGDRLTPSGPARQEREATSARKLLPDAAASPVESGLADPEPVGRRGPRRPANGFGTD
jgi:hypothetical protein